MECRRFSTAFFYTINNILVSVEPISCFAFCVKSIKKMEKVTAGIIISSRDINNVTHFMF